MTSRSGTDCWQARAANCGLGLAFITLAALKVPLLSRDGGESLTGLDSVLRSTPIVWAATSIEATLGVMALIAPRQIALPAIRYRIAVLVGVLCAVTVTATPVASCGCFGTREAGYGVRVAVLVGLVALTGVASSED